MSIYRIATEDGSVYKIEAADDATEQEVSDYFNNEYLPSLETKQEPPVTEQPAPQDPTGELTQFNKPVEQPSQDTIAKMQAEANPKDTSDFSRGFKTSYEQLPELGYGLEAGAYAIGESAFGEGGMLTQGKQDAVAKMIEAQKETQANAKESDSFTYAYQKAKEGDFNALADTVQYGLGMGLGQVSQAILTGGLGSTVAKTAAETFAKEYTAKLVEQEALKVAEQTAARELTQEQIQQQAVKNVTESIANKGRDYALGAQAVGLEGGEILGDLAKQSTEQNRSLTAGEVTKGLGATALAAAGEFYADRFGLDILGGKRLSEAGKYTEGLKGNLLRGAATGLKGGGVEGGTEFAQTLIEEAGKGKDPFSSESLRQAIDATALGFIGGGAISTVGGALSPAQQKPDQPATGEIDPSMLSGGLPNSTAQTTAQQPAQTSSDWQRTMGDIRNIVGENQLVDNETIAKDIAGSENIDDAIQVFNHVGEAISTDHAITHEVVTQEQLNIAAQRGNDQITGITEPLLQEPVKPKSDKLDATQESLDFIGQAVAQGGVELKGSMLYLPTGEKYSLNKAQRDHYNNLVTPTAETPIAQAPIAMGEGTVETRQGQDQISGVEEPKTPVTVDLYRGVPKGASTEDTNATVGNSLFMTPTEQIAKDYAGKEGGVSKSTHTFNNLLEAATWAEAKSKIGLTQADTMETLVNTAREQGYDGITFSTKFNGKEYIVLKPNETKAVATPAVDYETRNADRVTRIKEATTPEEAQSIYAEETSDNERHFEGTRKAEIAIKDTLDKLQRESANKKEDEAYAAGEWVFHFPTNSLSDANQMAKSMEKIEPKNEYKVIPWQNDGYLVQKRNIEAASKLPKEKTGTIENPILKKNGRAFTSQQGAQTHIRTNPELSKETHTWVKLGDEKYGIVTKDQVVSKATNPAANLRKVTGFENIVSMIGKLGGLSRVEMSERQLDDYKKNTSLFNNGVLSRTFDDMATVLRVDYGFSEIKTGDDLDTILKDSLRSKKPYYGYEGIDNAMDKIAADKADQEQQEQDELLNTYTNEELNAILDAKTQAEKDQLIKDFKAEKKRKADQEVDTVVDEMLGKGKTTTMDIFTPERKGKVVVGREVTVEGEQLANSGTKVKELYPNHWFYGDKGAQDKFNDTEIDYEGEYPNLESISLINTDSNIGGFYDQVEQAIYQTSQSDRTTLHELGHAVHHQLLNYRKLSEDERATLKELILGDEQANHPYLASDKELVAEFNLYAHLFPVKAKAYLPELYKELVAGRKEVVIKLGSQESKGLTQALKQANVTIEKGYAEEEEPITNKYKRKEYTEEERASQKKYRLTNFERERSKIDALQEELGFTLLDESDDFLLYSKFEGSSQHLIQYSLVSKNMSPPIGSMFVFEGSAKVLASRLSYYKTAREIYGKDKATDMMDRVDDKKVLEALDDKIGRGLFFPEDSNVYNLLRRMTSSSLDSIDPLETQEGRTKQIEKMLKGKIVPKSNIKFSKAKAQERLAPNGKPSNLNATQYEQVRTPEFKAWFGDWENDPENASKVVDENGEPRVVYHGSPQSGFSEFYTGNTAAFFTDLESVAASYAGEIDDAEIYDDYDKNDNSGQGIYPVFLNIQNPKTGDWEGAQWGKGIDGLSTDRFANRAKNDSYDGVILENVADGGWLAPVYLNEDETSTIYAVFNPNQIKSATGNTGEFSKESNDIRFSKDRAWDFKPMSDEMRQNLIDMGETDFVDRIDELENKVKTVADRAENHRLRLSHKDVLARIPELEKAAKKLKEGLITAYEYELLSEELLPMTPYEELPPISTEEEARYALANGKGQSEKKAAKYGLPMITFKNGEIVQLRLDIPSYSIHNKWVVSIHTPKSINGYNKQIQDLQNGTITPASDNSFKAGDSVGYQSVAIAKEVTFGMGEASALDIAEGSAKGTIATMMGKWEGTSIEEAKARAEEAMNSEEWVQVGMNPLKHSYFYDRDNLQPVIYADEVIQIGSLVLAKNPVYGRKSDFRFSQAQESTDVYHTDQSLKEGLTQAGDNAYGKGWTDRLLATGMFKIISALEANKIVGRGTMFHKAWHGSPYDYSKFDSSYMGTGEGAQAFGWGHYFTDAKQIAEWYKDTLSNKQISLLVDGVNATTLSTDYYGSEAKAVRILLDNLKYPNMATKEGLSEEQIKTIIDKTIDENMPRSGENDPNWLKNLENIRNYLSELKGKKLEIGKGKLYEVELAPTQEEYLDWNKPMSQQSDKVLESLKQWAEDSYPSYLSELEWKDKNFPNTIKGLEKLKSQTPIEWMQDLFNEPNYSGEDFYKELSEQVGYDEDASRYLNSMGIRGIRFKAEGGKSEANNYVIFDDRDINIEAKYSMAGDIEAFFNPADGKTYFVAENIDKATDLHYLMMHEVGVHALNMGGNKEEFESILKQVDNLVKVKNPAAMQGRQDALDADTPQEDLREETLAYLLKYAPKLKVVERFKAWLKNALRNMAKSFPATQRLGFIQWANKLSDQDLLYIANATLRKAPELLLKKSSEYEVAQAQEYFDRTGFMPYLSEGQLEIPVELAKFAIKTAAQAKHGFHANLGLPLNANKTVTLYYPTTNAIARKVMQDRKLIADNPNANRIYLTNQSAGYSVMENRGAITNEMDGAVVLIQIDPSLVQIDDSVPHSDGRRDFFIPIGEGEAFMKKPKMLKLFTLNQPREQGIAETTTLAEVGERIAKAVEEYKGLTDRQKATRYTRAKKVLKRYHNITTFLTENRKLEKTRVGDYGLTYEGNSVASQGLGLASAQKINNKNLSTCPVSAICEELCLGETSGQNLLYGGKGKYRSGARLSQYLKTEAMVLHPEEFAIAIAHEIKLYESWANQTFEYVRDPANPKRFLRDPVTNDRLKIDKEIYQPAMRLNVTSDIPPTVFEPIMRAYPNVEFYDYTKLNSDSKLPNLHITYSSTGVSQIVDGVPIFNKHSNWRQSVQRLDTGFNVAMVFSDKNDMPKTVTDEATGKVYQVWNGDNYDARFLDPKRDDGIGMIIGLTNKDNTGGVEDATERTKGFFVNYNKKRDGDNVTILDQSKFNARAETYNGEKVTPSIKFSKSKKAKEGEIVNRSTGYTAYDTAKPIQEEVDNKANYPEGVSLEEERDWLMQQLRRFDSFRKLNDKSNELINKYLTTMGRLPELGNYLGLRYQTLGKIDNVDDIVRNVFDTLQKATKEDSKEIYTYLTDNKATTEFILDPQMALMAKDLKEAITIIGKKLVEFNIIPMESFQMYEGRYLPRVYLEHIIQSSDRYQSLGSGKTLSPMGYAKRRDNNLPEEFRRLIKGEIKNTAYLASRTLSIPLRDIAMMEFFNQISDNEKWVWKQSLITVEIDAKTNRPTAIFDDDGVINYNATNSALEGKPKKVVVRKVTPYFLDKEADRILDQSYSAPEEDRKDMQDLANMMKRAASQAMVNMDAVPADFMKMPNIAKYGSLRGLVVHKLIYDDLVGTINTYGAAGEQTALENFFGNNGVLAKVTSAFKFSHVAINIPTQVTNLLSNGLLLHMSGVRFDKVPVRVTQAFKEVLNEGENYKKMIAMGGRKATFSNQELSGITEWLLENEAEFSDKDMDWFSVVHIMRELSYLAGKTVRGANNLHQNIEMVFKVAKFIDMKAKGANDETAAVMAHQALFDYSFIPRWAKWLRTVPMGIPFITWTIKSFEATLRTAANRPTTFLPYYMLGYAMSLAAGADFGDDGEDKLKAILKLLPERMQRGGSIWILPIRDDAGRTQLIDMKNLFPWGKTAEAIDSLSKLVGNQDVAELRTLADSVGVFSSPITQAVVAINTNKDAFTGKQIVDENDPPAAKLQSILEYTYGMMSPPMLGGKGDIATLVKSQFPSQYEGIMNKDGSPKKTEQQAFIHLFTGLSVKSVDIDFEKYKKLSAFENMVTGIEAQLSKELSSNPNLDEESRDRVVKKYTDRIDRVMEKRDKFEKETSVLN